MKGRPGNPGLRGRLLDKSMEAYILSLETINRLSVKYRVETFAYLICNAWELLLKAKLIEDKGNSKVIYYKKKRGQPRRSWSLRDCLKQVFQNEKDPVRCNIQRVADLRDESVHIVITQVPKDVLGLFQACVLNYHKQLVDWFDMSLSNRVSVGMMTIVYDFSPEQFDLESPILRRQLKRDAVQYLTRFQAEIRDEFETLGKPAEYSIDIDYKLALVKKIAESDIVLSTGQTGVTTGIAEVPKDSGKTHPYRETELLNEVNAKLNGLAVVNSYDIRCLVKVYGIKKRPEFHYKCCVLGSPTQYSRHFVDWIMGQYDKNNQFFVQTRRKARSIK